MRKIPTATGNASVLVASELEKSSLIMTDTDLIDRILQGERAAGELFVLRFRRLILAVLSKLGLALQEREDVFQQVFIHLWEQDCRRLQAWRRDGPFISYLTRLVVRLAHDYYRHQASLTSRAILTDDSMMVEAAAPSVETVVESRLQYAAITLTICSLSERDASLICLRHLAGMTYQEIAEYMGITVNHVGVALWKAERRTRDTLCKRYPGLFDFECRPVRKNLSGASCKRC